MAERVYCDMMVNSRNQSLIVSGESGAGKTEACKRVMTYLTAISRARSDELADKKGVSRRASVGVENVEEKILMKMLSQFALNLNLTMRELDAGELYPISGVKVWGFQSH